MFYPNTNSDAGLLYGPHIIWAIILVRKVLQSNIAKLASH